MDGVFKSPLAEIRTGALRRYVRVKVKQGQRSDEETIKCVRRIWEDEDVQRGSTQDL